MSVAQTMLAEFEQEAKTTRKFLERLPGDKLEWRPHTKSMTAGELALHIATTPAGVLALASKDVAEAPNFDGGRPTPRNVTEVLDALEQSVAADELAGAAARLVPLSGLLLDLPAVMVGEEGLRRVGHGRELEAEHVLSGFPSGGVERVRLLDEGGELVALAVPRGLDGSGASPYTRPTLHPDLVLIG